MKKFLVAILVVLSTCFFALGITGCKEEHVHTPSEWIVDEQATCTEKGIKHKECTDCKEVLENGTIEKLTHVESEWIIDTDATCESTGTKHKECVECNVVLRNDIINKLLHTPSEWIVDEQATCAEKGIKHKECTDCKEVLENDTIEKLNHDTQWVVVKDCTEAEYGSYQQKCTDCGDYLGQVIKTTPLVYTLNDDGKSYSVTDCNVSDSVVVIQSTFNGLPVTSIGNGAFSRCYSLQSIEIPNSVTSIGDSAFYDCDSLQSIEIPNSVTSIGDSAFYDCRLLQSITIPDSVTSIGNGAFYHCYSLQSITVAEDNTAYKSIDGNLYSKDGKTLIQYAIGKTATSFTISEGVTSIGSRAFNGCNSLQRVTIPNSVTSIGSSAFYDCYSLQYNKKDGLKYLGNSENKYLYLADVASRNITSATIESSCKFIGEYAFSYCYSLESVTIGNSVTSIDYSAFMYCNSLQSIEIPNSVKSIGNNAFNSCSSLQNVTIGNSVTSIGNGAFSSCDSLQSVTIGNSVTSIGDGAFYCCSSLQSIEIPNSVTSIGEKAFYGCSSLKYNEKDGLKYLGNSENKYLYLADVASTNITSATIESTCKIIGAYAFYYCESLQSIEIPNGVTSIGYGAFAGCDSLKYNEKDGLKYLGNSENKYLYLADVASTNITSATIESTCKFVGPSAFYNCDSLQSIEIPNSVTSIGNWAFSGCESLESVTIPNSVTSIGNYAFRDCDSLETIYCEAESQPSGWSSDWKYDCNAEVIWGYKG